MEETGTIPNERAIDPGVAQVLLGTISRLKEEHYGTPAWDNAGRAFGEFGHIVSRLATIKPQHLEGYLTFLLIEDPEHRNLFLRRCNVACSAVAALAILDGFHGLLNGSGNGKASDNLFAAITKTATGPEFEDQLLELVAHEMASQLGFQHADATIRSVARRRLAWFMRLAQSAARGLAPAA